jgi:hypothetical protein
MELLDSMRIKTRLDIFREFLRDNPESVEAKALLLRELQQGNGNKAALLLAELARSNPGTKLPDDKDSELWGEFIRVANSLVPQLLARTDSYGSLYRTLFRNREFKESGLLQQFAARHIDSIEDALRDRPHSRHLWQLWAAFSPYLPNKSLPMLLADLTPVPTLPDFPPAFLYPGLIQNYKSLENWRAIINLAEPIWEAYQNMADAKEAIAHRLTQQLLEQYINPLCEAYEKLGHDSKAEKARATWKQAGGWSRPQNRSGQWR